MTKTICIVAYSRIMSVFSDLMCSIGIDNANNIEKEREKLIRRKKREITHETRRELKMIKMLIT